MFLCIASLALQSYVAPKSKQVGTALSGLMSNDSRSDYARVTTNSKKSKTKAVRQNSPSRTALKGACPSGLSSRPFFRRQEITETASFRDFDTGILAKENFSNGDPNADRQYHRADDCDNTECARCADINALHVGKSG